MNVMPIEIVESPEDAPNYARDNVDIRGLTITKVVVVKRGMESGKASIDFQLVAKDGSEFVAMTTGTLLIALAQVIAANQ